MGKYEVTIVKQTIETMILEVDSASENEAKSKALKEMKRCIFDYISLGESTESTITNIKMIEL